METWPSQREAAAVHRWSSQSSLLGCRLSRAVPELLCCGCPITSLEEPASGAALSA